MLARSLEAPRTLMRLPLFSSYNRHCRQQAAAVCQPAAEKSGSIQVASAACSNVATAGCGNGAVHMARVPDYARPSLTLTGACTCSCACSSTAQRRRQGAALLSACV